MEFKTISDLKNVFKIVIKRCKSTSPKSLESIYVLRHQKNVRESYMLRVKIVSRVMTILTKFPYNYKFFLIIREEGASLSVIHKDFLDK